MRVELMIDSLMHQIDTRDPELLGRWLVEMFARVRWTPATFTRVQVWPSWVQDEFGQAAPDWIADSRIITNATPIKSPQDFVDMLQAQINEGGRP